MTVSALLDELSGLDVRLEAEGDRLRVNGPRGILTPETLDRVKRHKGELLALLRSRLGIDSAGLGGELLREVETMRRGDSSDWMDWSPACRGAWAHQTLETIESEGLHNSIPEASLSWLRQMRGAAKA